ncbi:hypothetical protein H7169_00170, partial [Candidatus Gracilibacteria bacterium]|nr:hypothetical protein [Candidatus Gracilibacteria bacterium]
MNTYIFIPGGETFADISEYENFIISTLVDWNSEPFSVKEEKRKWKSELATKLTEAGNLVYTPNFPNPINASYNDWK